MPTLTGTKPADTYGYLLQLSGGVTSSLKQVEDGLGSDTALWLSTVAVHASGNLTVSGNIATSGTVTGDGSTLTNLTAAAIASGTLAVARGGTGATTASGARDNLLPDTSAASGKFLRTDGSDESWGYPDHATLSNLAYASSGHTGFAGTGVANSFTATQTVQAPSTSGVALIAKASGAPTVDVQQWQTSAGVTGPRVTKDFVVSSPTLASATNNEAFGAGAGISLTTGDNNTFVGVSAGAAATSGSSNVAVGKNALTTITTVNGNTAVGHHALRLCTVAENTAVGYLAGAAVSNSTGHTFVGSNAGKAVTTGANNTFLGYYAGQAASTGGDNVAIGALAGYSIAGGNYNVCIGGSAGLLLAGGSLNLFLGYAAGYSLTSGTENVCLGTSAGYYANANYNVLIGSSAGGNLTSGGSNLCVGYRSGYGNQTGTSNVFVGMYSGYGNGVGAGSGNNSSNAALGYSTLYAVTTGGENAAVGYSALAGLTTGSANTALGKDADTAAASTNYATALGYRAVATDNELGLSPFTDRATFYGYSTAVNKRRSGGLKHGWLTGGSGEAAYSGYVTVGAYDGSGTTDTFREGMRVAGSGAATAVSFFGGTPQAKPTVSGSLGGNAALTNLVAALASLGLLTDSTSA